MSFFSDEDQRHLSGGANACPDNHRGREMTAAYGVTHSHLYATVGGCTETVIDLSMKNDPTRLRETDGESDCCTFTTPVN
ncbi:hypothetical protein KIN20_010175 [Parelaphostrongylus tenuis]|uniref:Uncharacterized protein n=1 Tax=Parelaphostrongylus tenuis TaxID=148309 RepID=A0AAD5QK45_PARTN|nr:hypothetical protein KIN20_010175 [Parelaphostrongylus tenuis]